MTSTDIFFGPYMEVESAWIDYNGHLNMAYYNVLFDRSGDAAFALLGLGPDLAASRRRTTYTAEAHIRYLRELHEGDKVRASFQLVDYDSKRLHSFMELYHEDGWLSATSEALTLHVDMNGPKVTEFDSDIMERIEAMGSAHSSLPRPDAIGRSIGILKKRD